jgi:hypothetical protein
MAQRQTVAARLSSAPIVSAVNARGGLGELTRRLAVGDRELNRIRRAYHRAVADGTVTYMCADWLCCRVLREHPSLVYGADWWANTEVDVEAISA